MFKLEMGKANNFIPDLYVNQFRNYRKNLIKKPEESFFFDILCKEIKFFKESKIQIKKDIKGIDIHNKSRLLIHEEFVQKEFLEFSLYNIDIKFYIFSRTFNKIAKELNLNEIQQCSLVDFNFISNKNTIKSYNITNMYDVNKLFFTNFVDYVFHSLILITQKNKYKKADFELFIRIFKPLLKNPELNIIFRKVLDEFFNFIEQFFIKKEINDTINFSKDDKKQNLHLMKEYNIYFNNSIENTIDFFQTIQFSDTMIDFLEEFNSGEIYFISLLKNTLNKYENLLINLVDDNYSIENNNEFSSTYIKTVAQVLSPKEHYLTFIYNMNISEVNNKKCFPLLSDALRDGIFFDTLFSVFLKEYRKDKLDNFSKNNKINVFNIINSMNKGYDPRFKNLTVLFISHYLGLSMNQSYNLADNLNKITNENNASGDTVSKKTYQKYYKKTKKPILDLKHEIGKLINID